MRKIPNNFKPFSALIGLILLIGGVFVFANPIEAVNPKPKFKLTNLKATLQDNKVLFTWGVVKSNNVVATGPAHLRFYTNCSGQGIDNNGRFDWDIAKGAEIYGNYSITVPLANLDTKTSSTGKVTVKYVNSLYTFTINENLVLYGVAKVPVCKDAPEQPTTGTVKGTVSEQIICVTVPCNPVPVTGAVVNIYDQFDAEHSELRHLYKKLISDTNGSYSADLPAGKYFIGAIKPCPSDTDCAIIDPANVSEINVTNGQILTKNILFSI